MDKNEYRRRLEEVAVIKEKKPVKTAEQPRWAKEIVIEIDEETGEEIEVEREVTENPTLGIEIVKIKDSVKLCELGCGDVVTNQLIEKKLHLFPKKHWRETCKNCNLTPHPAGIGFIKGGAQVQNEYRRYYLAQDNPDFAEQYWQQIELIRNQKD